MWLVTNLNKMKKLKRKYQNFQINVNEHISLKEETIKRREIEITSDCLSWS